MANWVEACAQLGTIHLLPLSQEDFLKAQDVVGGMNPEHNPRSFIIPTAEGDFPLSKNMIAVVFLGPGFEEFCKRFTAIKAPQSEPTLALSAR